MTADAKVGLLLGLVFIVIIAFLVNGLPNFLQTANADDVVTNNITTPIGPDFIIDKSVMETADQLNRSFPLRQTEPPEEEVVFRPAPEASTPSQEQHRQETPSYSVVNPQDNVVEEPIQQATRQTATTKTKTRVHVVKSGENLAVIAQKYYGQEEGNRRAVIQKLYEANHDVLPAADKIRVGDKIKVPALEDLFASKQQSVRSASNDDASETLLSKFSNLFERADKEDNPKTTKAASGQYVVQEGDTLWSIAQERLGNGNRYKEIVKLNKIQNEDEVVAGKVLKLPR